MDLARPSRRRLLRGAAAGAATAALGALATGRAQAADYPPTHWIPASTSNYTVSDRPAAHPVQYVVIHVTQETFQDAMRIFQDPARQVSSHYMVASGDGYVGQFVREKDIAWHAGNWTYNTRSIGIEHEGWVDEPEWFTDVMYRQSALLTAAVCDRYGIPRTRAHVIGHSEVPGATHTDPGPLWDWTRYMKLVAAA
ncbi:peptidoglycan recognition family protein [Streptomyces sp. NPDC001941]|uniref:N-acetylmuramoyl-L-alanine amidase n=1 Tax=Streptomyces sp. NPDC001941 TaxID=3154659 RepID=UPI0033248D95